MGPHEVIILASVLIIVVSGYCNPGSELERLNNEIAECESNNSPFFVLLMLKQISNNTLTFEQFVEKLHPFCEKPSHTLTCLKQNVNVREDCQENDRIQSTLNTRAMIWNAAEFLCENNATRYMDLAVGDGPLCYANDLHYKCAMQSKNERVVMERAPLSNDNICSFVDATINCLSIYDNCQNQNVRLHIKNFIEHFKSRLDCSK